MQKNPPPPKLPRKPVSPPAALPVEDRRWLPADWTHSDTLALEAAHETITNYTSLFSAEFAQLLRDPATFADRITAIQMNDLAAERDRDRLASFDRSVIAGVLKKYDELLAAARAQDTAAST